MGTEEWLRFRAPNAGGHGSIPGRRTRSHTLQRKILHATIKTEGLACYN